MDVKHINTVTITFSDDEIDTLKSIVEALSDTGIGFSESIELTKKDSEFIKELHKKIKKQ